MRDNINPRDFFIFIFCVALIVIGATMLENKKLKQVQHVVVGNYYCAVGEDCHGNLFIHKMDTINH